MSDWDPFGSDDERAVELIKGWNPKLHPRIPGGHAGGGRFGKASALLDAAKSKATVGARKSQASLAGFRERRRAPKLKPGQKYIRVLDPKPIEGMMKNIMAARKGNISGIDPNRKLGVLSETGQHAVARGTDKKLKRFRLPTDREQVEDANPVAIPGEKSRKKLSGGRMAQRVDLVELNNGSKIVHKVGDVRSTDAEILSSRVANVMGAGPEVPRTERVGRNQHKMPFVKGMTVLEAGIGGKDDNWNPARAMVQQAKGQQTAEEKYFGSPESRRIGAMDFLTANPDRNLGNMMIDEATGNPVAIDMGEAFHDMSVFPIANAMFADPDAQGYDWPTNPAGQLHTWKLFEAMENGEDPGFDPRDWSAGLADMKGEFKELGREDWHEAMMERHAMLVDHYEKSFPSKTQKTPKPGDVAERGRREVGGTEAIKARKESETSEFRGDAEKFANGELGVRNARQLQGGQVAEGVSLVELENGRKLVDKRTSVPNEPEREAFSHHVGTAVGAKVPESIVPKKGRVVMEQAPGITGNDIAELDAKEIDRIYESPEFREQSKAIGALDMLTGNPDRNPGNWLWDDETKTLSAIDNGMGYLKGWDAGKIHKMGMASGPWAKRAFAENPVASWEALRPRLEALPDDTDSEKNYKKFVLDNLDVIIAAKKAGGFAHDLAREVSTRYNWGMYVETPVELARKVKWDPTLHPRFAVGSGRDSGRFMRNTDNGGGGWDPVDPRVDLGPAGEDRDLSHVLEDRAFAASQRGDKAEAKRLRAEAKEARFQRDEQRGWTGPGSRQVWEPDPFVDPRVDEWDPGESIRNRNRGMASDAVSSSSSDPTNTWGRRFAGRMGRLRRDDGDGPIFHNYDEPRTMSGDDIRRAVVDSAPERDRMVAYQIAYDPEFLQGIGERPVFRQTVGETYHQVGERVDELMTDRRALAEDGQDRYDVEPDHWGAASQRFGGQLGDDETPLTNHDVFGEDAMDTGDHRPTMPEPDDVEEMRAEVEYLTGLAENARRNGNIETALGIERNRDRVLDELGE